MHLRNFLKIGLAAIAMVSTLVACGGDDDDHPPATPGNIAVVAQAQGFNALLAAVTKAGLTTTLTDANAQLTVFAPTDAAFGALATKLGFADATAMVNALPPSALQSILTYHVLGSKKLAADLIAGGATQATAYSFEGAPARLSFDFTSGVKITDAALTVATVTTPNVAASNGVIHAVDKVLVPPGVRMPPPGP